jgi:hypothetical protein
LNLAYGLNTEEDVACQLADLALQLHKRGLMEPYQHVVKARDSLLLVLDGKKYRCVERKKTAKGKETRFCAGRA